jgi:hypothetical protein
MSEQQIIETALIALHRTTGLQAHVVHSNSGGLRISIDTPLGTHTFIPEIKAVDRFQTPGLIKARPRDTADPPLLIAPYITRDTAEHCRNLHLSFIDTAGNTYIQAPGLLAYVVGQPRPPELNIDRARALTPAGLQVTFAIICRPDLLRTNYRTLAAAAKVALGTVGPAIKDLRNRGLLDVDARGVPCISDSRRLLDEWVSRYPTTLRRKLHPQGFEADPRILQAADLKKHSAFWSGEAAADHLTHMLRPEHFTIYTNPPPRALAAEYRMRARPEGNVELLDTFWEFEWEGSAANLVPAPLVYADLMATRDGRNLEVANLVYDRFIEPKFGETQ